mgnify:CR=1 FL=1
MRNFIIRALTGIAYVAILVACTVFSPVTAFFFFACVAAACVGEFCLLVNRHAGASVVVPLNVLAAFLLAASVWLYCIGSPSTGRSLALYVLLVIYLLVSELYRASENPLLNWALSLFSHVYAAVPFALLPMLSVRYDAFASSYAYTWQYPLSLFVFLWANDTGAYLFGVSLQRYFPAKLFPRISPRKSWVGSIGGGLLTLALSVVAWRLFPDTLPLWQWLGFALVVVVFGTWGDLVESLLKRHFDIKDSGHVLPGHGGMLDRFDSALLAIPAVVVYFLLIQSFLA